MGWLNNLLDLGSVGTQLYGGHQASQANAAQLRYLQDVEARRRLEYDQAQAEEQRRWDAEQALLAPRRAASDAIRQRWAQELGIPFEPAPMPTAPPPPPSGMPRTGIWNPTAPNLQADGTYRVPTSGGTLADLAQPMAPPLAGAPPALVPRYSSADLGSLARRRRG